MRPGGALIRPSTHQERERLTKRSPRGTALRTLSQRPLRIPRFLQNRCSFASAGSCKEATALGLTHAMSARRTQALSLARQALHWLVASCRGRRNSVLGIAVTVGFLLQVTGSGSPTT